MSEFGGVIRLQVEMLLGELRRQQETRCQELMYNAKAQSKELLRMSRRQLRERGRQALGAERKRREVALRQARNRIRAQESQRVQLLYAEILRQAWPQLNEQLQQRWSDKTSRKAWCEMLLDEACNALQPATWRIEHPQDWSDQDARWLAAGIEDRGLPQATQASEPRVCAGLKISNGSACLDGTIDGLLVRASRVEARLLAAWEHEAGQAMRDRDD